MKYDYLTVGSGLFGVTFAYCAKQAGKSVLVIDSRPHIGGNVYQENVEGINVHKYGPHVFHTSNEEVWKFVNQFTKFNHFELHTIANYKGELYNLPFNMNTFHQMWEICTPEEAEKKIKDARREAKELLKFDEPRNLEEQALSLVGRDIYKKLIKEYTEKQWGRKCTDLPSFIIRRLPVRFTYDNNYFNDIYQGIPIDGYNKMIEKMLEGVDVMLNTNFFDSNDDKPNCKNWRNFADKLVYTGKIDDFFGNCYGNLDYRTVRFETEIINKPNYQGVAIMNFTSHDAPYTRIMEHKHFEKFGNEVYDNPKTAITREYSVEYETGMEPYYPINNDRNMELYAKYKALADKETDIIFGGRLAEYKYYDMAPTIENALKTWKKHMIV
ncbi:UDP-galactopyranose mutase [Prevotella sp. E15-22]|uniref:UDP-galactopyranose mutase n=1 Tax=Prevotella sp. E15-22 TaxID=2937774 RepID=UPI0020538972|nr:UDP-galactopyranose mutase [Prevotella sp. E15-22]UPS43912.1 UDP-galactopyranose mutase [Prevotella sp. E15-22]